ncbi:MAG: MFS transporter [Eubacteriales bacterium]
MEYRKAIQKKKLRFWGAADIGEGFVATVTTTFFAVFLTDIARLPLAWVSLVMLITSWFDFFIAPTAGAIMSTIKPKKWGKLRSWLFICPPIAAFFFVFHFASFSNPILTAITTTGSFMLARLTYNISWTANLSMIGVMSSTPKERAKLTSQRMAGFNIGKLSSGYIAPIIVAYFLSTNERFAYPAVMVLAGVILISGHLIHFNISRGYENEGSSVDKRDTLTLKEILISLGKNPQLLITILIDLSSNMGTFVLPSLVVYYYNYVSGIPTLLSLHLFLTGLGGLCGTLIIRVFGDKIKDHKKQLLFTYLIVAVLMFSCRFVAYQPYLFLAINVITQTIIGTNQPLELGLYMDNVIYNEWKTGINANSAIMGMANLPVKLAIILRSIIVPFALMSAGYVAGMDPTPELKNSLINAYTIIPAIIPLIGFILLKFFYKFSREDVAKMKLEIQQRKKKEEHYESQ